MLGLEGLDDHAFTNYKDRMLSIETVQSRIGGAREGRCLNTTAFPADIRCLTTIMMFNLYPVRKLTTINNARAIFLIELKETPSLTSAFASLTPLWMRPKQLQGPS